MTRRIIAALVVLIIAALIVLTFTSVKTVLTCKGEITRAGQSRPVVLYASLIQYRWWTRLWGVVWIVWSLLRKSPWVRANVQKGMMDREWNAVRAWGTALSVEYITAVLTALPIGCVAYLIKGWVT
jgi:hypothetical protein